MTKLSPLTKLLIAVAVLAVPYLLWTREDQPPAPAAPAAPTSGGDGARPAATASGSLALPPLKSFAAIVERPLFSPSRRPPLVPEPPAAPVEEVVEEPTIPEQTGPVAPNLRFFGTILQGGRTQALVELVDEAQVTRLGMGDRLGDWEVVEVSRHELVLAQGQERLAFSILKPPEQEAE